jgi:hypothetical protein
MIRQTTPRALTTVCFRVCSRSSADSLARKLRTLFGTTLRYQPQSPGKRTLLFSLAAIALECTKFLHDSSSRPE